MVTQPTLSYKIESPTIVHSPFKFFFPLYLNLPTSSPNLTFNNGSLSYNLVSYPYLILLLD
jgi:hypothetical protein